MLNEVQKIYIKDCCLMPLFKSLMQKKILPNQENSLKKKNSGKVQYKKILPENLAYLLKETLKISEQEQNFVLNPVPDNQSEDQGLKEIVLKYIDNDDKENITFFYECLFTLRYSFFLNKIDYRLAREENGKLIHMNLSMYLHYNSGNRFTPLPTTAEIQYFITEYLDNFICNDLKVFNKHIAESKVDLTSVEQKKLKRPIAKIDKRKNKQARITQQDSIKSNNQIKDLNEVRKFSQIEQNTQKLSDLASRNTHQDMIEQLHSYNKFTSQINPIPNNASETLLEIAITKSDERNVKLLLNNGTNQSKISKLTNETAFHLAAKVGNENILRMLDRNFINDKDNKGYTPLHYAVEYGHVKAAKFLIEAGVSINEQDNNGITALHIAVNNKSIELIDLLILWGANVNCMDNRSNTPLSIASAKGAIEIVDKLILAGKSSTTQEVCLLNINKFENSYNLSSKEHEDLMYVCYDQDPSLPVYIGTGNIQRATYESHSIKEDCKELCIKKSIKEPDTEVTFDLVDDISSILFEAIPEYNDNEKLNAHEFTKHKNSCQLTSESSSDEYENKSKFPLIPIQEENKASYVKSSANTPTSFRDRINNKKPSLEELFNTVYRKFKDINLIFDGMLFTYESQNNLEQAACKHVKSRQAEVLLKKVNLECSNANIKFTKEKINRLFEFKKYSFTNHEEKDKKNTKKLLNKLSYEMVEYILSLSREHQQGIDKLYI
jgi:ankyrin repeat protein